MFKGGFSLIDHRLITFLELCKHMNYTKAASALHITQPAVTQHIKYLENYYQVSLFHQEGKKLFLTDQGKLLQEMTSALLVDSRRISRILAESLQRKKDLRLGATLTIGEHIMPAILNQYLKDYPDTDLTMYVRNTQTLLSMLNDGSIDFAIIEGYFDKSLYAWHRLSREPFIAVCGKDYPLPGHTLPLETLLKERLIVREPGSGTRNVLERILEENNLSIQSFAHRAEISNLAAVKSLVRQNQGITFLYEAAAKTELLEGSLVPIEIEHLHWIREFNFIYLKDTIFQKEYDRFFDYCKNILSPEAKTGHDF